ncbi:MAG: sigma-54 dependent transcriptional regulator [Deltaproteobacteria bacterium]|nr:sigma-54 dependent transcriptional regulator [Deltaproteobacteria bacterium]
MARILVVDDERSMREFLSILLRKSGHEVETTGEGSEALRRVAGEEFDLVVTDLRLGDVTGIEVLEATKRYHPQTEVILVTAFATTENAIQAMKAGAYDYLTKPFKVDEVSLVVQNALERRALVRENTELKAKLATAGGGRDRLAELVGHSPAMQPIYSFIEKVAPTRSTILITGESGTGKELVARAIHARSSRAGAPFVAINCGAIPEGLIESELFGHVKGAFTGAHQDKQGIFEAGSGGTLFLDEIGDLALAMQVKLLRVLQEHKIKRVGDAREIEVDVRLVAATNRELSEDVEAGTFREDIYYRLNVLHVEVPPLRERREDIPVLAELFLARHTGADRKLTLSRPLLARLLDYRFPGNVRELENLMERAATLADGDEVTPDTLPAQVLQAAGRALGAVDKLPEEGMDLQAHLDAIELRLLQEALERCGGKKKAAAALLGLTFRSFRYRLKKLTGED